MDVVECIEGRTSIRAFKADPVDDEIVDEGLRLANLAPSAGNLQSRDFIVVRDAATKKALMHAAYHQEFVRTAPLVVVFCANLQRVGHYAERGKDLYCLQDVAAAVENFSLFLHSKGLGSVWVGAFDEAKAAEVLGTPAHVRPVAMVPVGYPAEKGIRRKRFPNDELVHKDRW